MINKNNPPTKEEIQQFLAAVNFSLPIGFIDFFENANGAEISSDVGFFILWPLTEMIQLNSGYKVDEYIPGFFVFASNGGDNAYAIEKFTGSIYEIPFIGMSKDEAVLISETFTRFIQDIS
ncbi:SMI1/KNR4 family protein [Pseudochryseolinea flava]|uniref:Knr4/Smi1-like domain-containing protein n=1 Tax=Pseudochryseolinea flava TaxID=2059302 RepID=A0A364Y434_9BACT|nr:SMI1/KNR4 family protein [Pseudochryseolinea flava]RAW00575.1 hypothetical protein DQQ10_13325 [Pseudochryseolinea flava]